MSVRDFSVTVKPQNSKSKVLMLVFLALAFLLVSVSFFLESYKGVVGVGAVLSLTTAILIYTKYVTAIFHYDIIAEGEDEPIFVVRQTVGRRNVTLARIAFRDIEKIEKETLSERRAHKSDSSVMKYAYMPTLAPEISYRITAKIGEQKSEIVIEGSDEFAEMIMNIANTAKDSYTEE